MRVTKSIRKDINKLAKLVSKDKSVSNSNYIRNDLTMSIELGICKKGMIRHLIDQVESGAMLPSTIKYLIYANQRSKESES